MSSGEKEALRLAEAHDRTVAIRKALNSGVQDNASKLAEATAAELRRLVSEREADREALKDDLDDALNALIAVRDTIPDLHSYGNLAGNTLGSRVDDAISKLRARVG